MKQSEALSIGNPVDTWWNNTRSMAVHCIEMLSTYPAAPNAQIAAKYISEVQEVQEMIFISPCPKQAKEIRGFFLDALNNLRLSLHYQAHDDLLRADSSHTVAYNRFMMVCFLLLHRGIYEPAPLGLH